MRFSYILLNIFHRVKNHIEKIISYHFFRLPLLANHPEKDTAIDVQKFGGMMQSITSTMVERLVQGGYPDRQPMPDDRRKIKLVCTDATIPELSIIKERSQYTHPEVTVKDMMEAKI